MDLVARARSTSVTLCGEKVRRILSAYVELAAQTVSPCSDVLCRRRVPIRDDNGESHLRSQSANASDLIPPAPIAPRIQPRLVEMACAFLVIGAVAFGGQGGCWRCLVAILPREEVGSMKRRLRRRSPTCSCFPAPSSSRWSRIWLSPARLAGSCGRDYFFLVALGRRDVGARRSVSESRDGARRSRRSQRFDRSGGRPDRARRVQTGPEDRQRYARCCDRSQRLYGRRRMACQSCRSGCNCRDHRGRPGSASQARRGRRQFRRPKRRAGP